MSARTALFAVTLALAAAGAAAGKPPGLPADPRAEGRERTPVEREFYLPERPTPRPDVGEAGGGRRGPVATADVGGWRALPRLWASQLGLALPWVEWY